MRAGGLLFLVYVVIGVIVAASQGYFADISRFGDILEIIVAILVWPALLFGVNIEIGGGPRVDTG